MANTTVGVLLAALSAFFNGTFGILAKLKPVQHARVSPLHFNLFVAVGLVISSLPLWLRYPVLTPWGLLSGVLFTLSTGCSFFAIKNIGVSLASALWSGVAILASFIWGLRVNGDKLHSRGWSIPALLLLVGGLGSIAVMGRLSEGIREKLEEEDGEITEEEALSRERTEMEDRVMDPLHHPEEVRDGPKKYGIGVISAVCAGLFGGLVLAPKTFAKGVRGVAYLPSMGLGVLVAAPILTTGISLALDRRLQLPPKSAIKAAAAFGTAAGILWNLGNLFSILATERIGLAVAYPIFQCGLLVAGVWGIFLFNEIARPCIPAYVLSGVCLVLGAAFLALSK